MSTQTAAPKGLNKCPACKASVPEDGRFCTACGASMKKIDPPGPIDPHAESLLAEANLLRMRGLWPAAEGKCIDVLRTDPNNIHAHSLLGDLYRSQGRYEEAAQWYKLALDLDPNSRADKAKLEDVLREQGRLALRSNGSGSTMTGTLHGTQKLMGIAPANWLRGLTAISV